jgi:hypothetical protein
MGRPKLFNVYGLKGTRIDVIPIYVEMTCEELHRQLTQGSRPLFYPWIKVTETSSEEVEDYWKRCVWP